MHGYSKDYFSSIYGYSKYLYKLKLILHFYRSRSVTGQSGKVSFSFRLRPFTFPFRKDLDDRRSLRANAFN